MVKGIDHQTSGSVVVFMTSKLIAEIELGGDESNCFKKPPIMAFSALDYKGFPDLIHKWRDKALSKEFRHSTNACLSLYLR
jgi:hypothetical protein